MTPRSLQEWTEKLDFLETEMATAIDPTHKFSLKKKIEDARRKIDEIRNRSPADPSYRTMATRPDGFVHRHELDEIADLLTAAAEDAETSVGITTALRGAGRLRQDDPRPGPRQRRTRPRRLS